MLTTELCVFTVRFMFIFIHYLILLIIFEGRGLPPFHSSGNWLRETELPSYTEKRAGICSQFDTTHSRAAAQHPAVQRGLCERQIRPCHSGLPCRVRPGVPHLHPGCPVILTLLLLQAYFLLFPCTSYFVLREYRLPGFP